MRAFFAIAQAVLLASLFTACSANGARSFEPGVAAGSDRAGEAATKVTVKITVKDASPAGKATERRPRYFARDSKGLLLQAYAHGKSKVVARTVVNIAPGSPACAGSKASPRTCATTVAIPSSIARADFRISDFNAKPLKSAIPKSARLLAFGRLLDAPISTKRRNDFSVFLGGVVAGLHEPSQFVSLPGDGATHSLVLPIDPVDFGNDPITGGSKDPFANPIVVSLTEMGGSGHALLSLDGGAGASRVIVARSTDTITLDYDGGGNIGYGITVTMTAPSFSSGGKRTGGATESLAVSPLLLGSSSGDYASGILALKGNGEWQTIDVGELDAPGLTVYGVTTSHCDAIESTMPLAQSSGSSASFGVITRSTITAASAAGCMLTVSDGASAVFVEVSNAYSGSLGVPTIVTTPVPTLNASPQEMTVGPDGAVWFVENSAGKIGRIEAGPIGANGAIAETTLPFAASTPAPAGMIAGPDGKLWFTDTSNGLLDNLTTAGGTTSIPLTNPTSEPAFVMPGSNGKMWFTFYTNNRAGNVATTGGTQTYASITGYDAPSMALGTDGNLWFTENDANVIGKITPSGTVTEFPIPHPSAYPWGITAGPDGALWFTECNGGGTNTGAIGRIPTTAATSADIQEFSTNMTGNAPVDLTTGPDGALWFTYWNSPKIGRITTSGAITEYPIPNATSQPNSWGITAAPDGAIWFADINDNRIGRIAIGSSSSARHVTRCRCSHGTRPSTGRSP